MIDIHVALEKTEIEAKGQHKDLFLEACSAVVQLHRFIYGALGHREYLTFLIAMRELEQSDEFFDLLNSSPAESTHISIQIPRKEGENNAD